MEDLEVFRYLEQNFSTSDVKPVAKRKSKTVKGTFIRGPIPMDWLAQAAVIPRCNALIVGLVLFHLAGLRSESVGLVLSVERCKPFGLGRKAVQRGLADLESRGLIRVSRTNGRCPRVDIVADQESQ